MEKAESTSRRRFLFAAGTSLGSLGVLGRVGASAVRAEHQPTAAAANSARTIPFIHTTDLYSPPQDPDDHVDLATVYALPELDLRAVILDPTRKFVGKHDPGFVPVTQMNYLTGRAVPAAAGPIDALRSPSDTAKDRPRCEQAGIELLLDALSRCEEPAFVSVLGSARAVAAAWNREPKLLEQKIRAVARKKLDADPGGSFLGIRCGPHARLRSASGSSGQGISAVITSLGVSTVIA